MRTLFAFLILLQLGNFYGQNVKLICKESGTKIKLLEYNTYIEKIDTIALGTDSAEYKFKTDEALFYLENKGFKSTTQLILKKSVRGKKNRIVFEPLAAIPKREKPNKYISINKVSFNVKAKDYKKVYFENYLSYLENKTEHSSSLEKDFIIENTIFEGRLDRFLLKNGFVDTTNKLSLGYVNNVEVKININSVTENKIGRFILVEIEGDVDLDNKVTTKQVSFKSNSTIGYEYDAKNDGSLKSMFQDALERVLLQICNDSSLKDMFKNIEDGTNLEMSKWQIITIQEKEELPSLEKAVSAVVTVTQKNGHGSGCVISRDGYIITNHHVLGVDSSAVFILFGNGAKKRCRLVRTNPIYDLALLKVDTVFENVLKVNKDLNIKVGADVYAIGTPSDIDLGQSVSKGIISAKRKLEGKEYIQTDVSINRGNSGGALTNKSGELIGVVNAKMVGRGVEGLGFAIPSYYIEQALKIEIK